MKLQVSFRYGIILVLLSAVLLLNALSAFFCAAIDQLVNVDLYDYGLQFSNDWAAQYQMYRRLTLILVAASMLMGGLSMICVVIYRRTHRDSAKLASYPLLVSAATAAGLSVICLNRLDNVVHGDLYRYGLQFSSEWAYEYWTYARLTLGLQGLAITAYFISLSLVYLGGRAPIEIKPTHLISSTLSLTGTAALVLSIYYGYQILAFIGLGLVLWGIIIAYIAPEAYVRKTILDATTLSALKSLDQMLTKMKCVGTAVYLPPKYLADVENGMAYIPRDNNDGLPTTEQLQLEDGNLTANPDGTLVTPPGNELARLLESLLGMSFTKVDLPHLKKSLTMLLTEKLEIAESVAMEIDGNIVRVIIKNTIYETLSRETMKLSDTSRSLGCPAASAIACVLAKTAGRPVRIFKEHIDEDNRIISVEYSMLDEPKPGSSR